MAKPSFTVYQANCLGNAANCLYPRKVEVTDDDSFRTAVAKDHVFAEYADNYRSVANFKKSDAVTVECDNDHSDDPADWVQPADVAAAFKDVTFAVHFSRHHMKVKNGKVPRPKFHLVFPIEPVTGADAYAAMKAKAQEIFPYFDTQALDAARFFFGTPQPEVEFHEGSITLTQFLADYDSEKYEEDFDAEIPEGTRNTTLSRFAGRTLKRYGDTEEAYTSFLAEAQKCSVPLPDDELQRIWRSAEGFFHKKVEMQGDYISPEVYNFASATLRPGDYSDVGQAEVLAREYGGELRYSPATDYIRYNGILWQESKPRAQAATQELTARQLTEARRQTRQTWQLAEDSGAASLLTEKGIKKAREEFTPEQTKAYAAYEDACGYVTFVIKRRESKNITATIKEARPMLEIDPAALDADAFLLNTPTATYDLRKGLNGAREHRSEDFITKVTTVSPGTRGKEEWQCAVKLFFRNDAELIDYVQRIVGLGAIGRVYIEAIIISHGGGRNGKSTFWNVVSRALGTYSGNISADTLTVGCRRNVKPELAEAKGKRLLIAAELEEGTRLNTSNIKQFCSTDEIFAEKKYKDPFSFIPSHTLVLYTNHLPKVGANDPGTWRRLIVIPFSAVIEGKGDIKNYAEHLFENCGEAILAWIIEGAQKIIADDFRLVQPLCVKQAIEAYREDNDWLDHFITERCDVGAALREKSGELYTAYRGYCTNTGEYTRSTSDFYTALEFAGYRRHKDKTGSFVYGLKLKDYDSAAACQDFLGLTA
mgnify:CR=1 FL=1